MPSDQSRILLHIPAYREPELIPTIEDALQQAKYPERVVFGICRQFSETDGFDNLDRYRSDPRFKIIDMPHTEARGLAYARALINDTLLDDEEYILQLDSHHRFAHHWDDTLITWHRDLERDGYNPILTGYLPSYNPKNDPDERVQEPWMQRVNYFFSHGTIFIQPVLLTDWENCDAPVPSRFISGHFAFARNAWAKTVRHDPGIFFSGEEISLTVRSYTHGYDLFHPHRVVVWHETMRDSRDGKLVWDDMAKTDRSDQFWQKESDARARIRHLLGSSDESHDMTGFELGTVRTLGEYERYAGIHFASRRVQPETYDARFPPNPFQSDDQWTESLKYIGACHFQITSRDFPSKDYDFILVAFDDDQGLCIRRLNVSGAPLKSLMEQGTEVTVNERFLSDVRIARVVCWGYSDARGWLERTEIRL
ncbi:MAG: GlcNAc-transferase family protein [Pseudomonadota bacterium]